MTGDMRSYKQQAGEAAADRIESGMAVGLGTGTTAIWMVRRLAERLRAGELTDIVGVPTSERTRAEAETLDIPLATLNEQPRLDVTIDGADEIDPDLNLIKGGGGALLREKIVAEASKELWIVGTPNKRVNRLGETFELPVEVVTFGYGVHRAFLEGLGATVTLRTDADGEPYHTDSGNLIYDCDFGGIDDVQALADRLVRRAGIVEHGLFIGLATEVIIAGPEGLETRRKDR